MYSTGPGLVYTVGTVYIDLPYVTVDRNVASTAYLAVCVHHQHSEYNTTEIGTLVKIST